MTDRVLGHAVLSKDGVYRYSLHRTWRWPVDRPLRLTRWVMLNPSTAVAESDDATIRRCMGFARGWGHDGIVVHNAYALRSTDPAGLDTAPDPVGPANDRYLAGRGDGDPPLVTLALTIIAWGAAPIVHRRATRPGAVRPDPSRAEQVYHVLRMAGVTPHCMGLTKDGHPRHPLRLSGRTYPRPYLPTFSPAPYAAGERVQLGPGHHWAGSTGVLTERHPLAPMHWKVALDDEDGTVTDAVERELHRARPATERGRR